MSIMRIVVLSITLCSIIGCARTQKDWEYAKYRDTLEDYENFVQRHPSSDYSESAKVHIAKLQQAKLESQKQAKKENNRRMALLESYQIGETTEQAFLADNWDSGLQKGWFSIVMIKSATDGQITQKLYIIGVIKSELIKYKDTEVKNHGLQKGIMNAASNISNMTGVRSIDMSYCTQDECDEIYRLVFDEKGILLMKKGS